MRVRVWVISGRFPSSHRFHWPLALIATVPVRPRRPHAFGHTFYPSLRSATHHTRTASRKVYIDSDPSNTERADLAQHGNEWSGLCRANRFRLITDLKKQVDLDQISGLDSDEPSWIPMGLFHKAEATRSVTWKILSLQP